MKCNVRIGIMTVLLAVVCMGAAGAAPFQFGDVFAAVNNGQVDHYNAAGVYIETLNTGLGGYTTGMAFDSGQNLYVTDFSSNAISKFDNTGTLIGTFGSGYSTPECILFDSSGNAFVSSVGSLGIQKFDAGGNSLATYTSGTRTDWIELLPDQCTMLYTQEGSEINAHNVCTDTALPVYANLGHGQAFALRLLPDGSTLVADSTEVLRVDGTGAIIQHYSGFGAGGLFSLNLDPDGTSFWTGDYANGHFYKIAIATGAILMDVDSGKGNSNLYGLVVFGEQTQATGSIAGMKFNDMNGNGAKDAGDTGLGGWTIVLKDAAGAVVATTTTAADGSYSFGSLPSGTFTVSEVNQAGWVQTAPAGGTYTFPIAAGQHVTGADFGNTQGSTNAPEFPTTLIPVISIIGFTGIVLLIQRNRE